MLDWDGARQDFVAGDLARMLDTFPLEAPWKFEVACTALPDVHHVSGSRIASLDATDLLALAVLQRIVLA